ncbi:MAG: hypothetical protein ACOCZC_01225 [Halodesulfurarchaeum sp.]
MTDLDRAPIEVLAEYIRTRSPVHYSVEDQVRTTGGPVQNTPADGDYPFIQPGVDFAGGSTDLETAMVPLQVDHPAVPKVDR